MPIVHPYAPGAVGKSHGDDYYIVDIDKACIGSACVQVQMLVDLLSNNAEKARRVIANYKPDFASRQEYFKYLETFERSGDRISYGESGAEVSL